MNIDRNITHLQVSSSCSPSVRRRPVRGFPRDTPCSPPPPAEQSEGRRRSFQKGLRRVPDPQSSAECPHFFPVLLDGVGHLPSTRLWLWAWPFLWSVSRAGACPGQGVALGDRRPAPPAPPVAGQVLQPTPPLAEAVCPWAPLRTKHSDAAPPCGASVAFREQVAEDCGCLWARAARLTRVPPAVLRVHRRLLLQQLHVRPAQHALLVRPGEPAGRVR